MGKVYIVRSISDCCECSVKDLSRVFASEETAKAYTQLYDKPEESFVVEPWECEGKFQDEQVPLYMVQWYPFRTGKEDEKPLFLIIDGKRPPYNWQRQHYAVMLPSDIPENGIHYASPMVFKDDGFHHRWQTNCRVNSYISFDHAWGTAKKLMEEATGETLEIPQLEEAANA